MNKWIGTLMPVVAAMVGFGVVVEAAGERSLRSQIETGARSWWSRGALYAGGAAGASYSRDLTSGTPTRLQLLGAWTGDSLVFDAGVGTSRQTFSDARAAYSVMGGTFLEGAIRYRLTDRWQAGLVLDTLLNQKEAYSDGSGHMNALGLQALHESELSDEWLIRWGGRLQSGIGLSQGISMVMAEVQVGWHPNSAPRVVETVPVIQQPATHVANRPVISSAEIREDFLNFPVAKSTIGHSDERRLQELAQRIQPELVERIEVIGHSDATGRADRNQKLASERAEAVASKLREGGLASEMITVSSRGSAEPADLTNRAANRRVELKFVGVSDAGQLKKILTTIR